MTNHQVSDLSPLGELTNLKRLELYARQVDDLEPLAELTNLRILVLDRREAPVLRVPGFRTTPTRGPKTRAGGPRYETRAGPTPTYRPRKISLRLDCRWLRGV
ncbi:MAG: hypothetical protein H8E44_21950 [Planctomycetes bacterium]|nr:hypothetical protein [Planctomycetota bacterium]